MMTTPHSATITTFGGNCFAIKQKLQSFLRTKQIPNLILHGPSGSGKRTLLSEFLYDVYSGADRDAVIKSNVMVVNCSHGNKGIKFIRDEFKFFAKTNIQTNYGVPFKSIVLLNADCLTIDAQTALRRCIELFSHSTRFFIIVKDKQRLLNPILSRFCEIYVPEPENGISFHQQRLSRVFPTLYTAGRFANEGTGRFPNEGTNTLKWPDRNTTAIELMTTATQWYEQGISAIHLIRTLESDTDSTGWDRQDGAAIAKQLPSNGAINMVILCFYKIKDDIRHEKTLMFHILFMLYLCSNTDLKNMLMM